MDLESLSTQGLLDPGDDNLDFVLKRESLNPISIFRIDEGDFFLCYNGRRNLNPGNQFYLY